MFCGFVEIRCIKLMGFIQKVLDQRTQFFACSGIRVIKTAPTDAVHLFTAECQSILQKVNVGVVDFNIQPADRVEADAMLSLQLAVWHQRLTQLFIPSVVVFIAVGMGDVPFLQEGRGVKEGFTIFGCKDCFFIGNKNPLITIVIHITHHHVFRIGQGFDEAVGAYTEDAGDNAGAFLRRV